MKTLMAFFALFFFCPANAICQETLLEVRKWQDSTGKYSTDAAMLLTADDPISGEVRIKNTAGEIKPIPLKKLDKESQAYVRKQRRDLKSKLKNQAEVPETSADSSDASEFDGSYSWNQWRGPNRDGLSLEKDLLPQWPDAGPELLWSADGLGPGYSSVAISGNLAVTMGNRNGTEHIIAVDLSGGKQVWATSIGGSGESNCTPTIDNGRVFGISYDGVLACVDLDSGTLRWKKSFPNDFGGKMMSQWGYSESPLVDGEQLIVTPGGPMAMIVALEADSGKTIWQTPMQYGGSRGTDGAGYASVVISNGGGIKQYITLVGRGLISVAAKDGTPLWQYEKIANRTANVPTPIVDGDYVFCSSGYNDGGTALLRLNSRGRSSVTFQEVYYLGAGQLQNHHGGMVKIGDYVYMGMGHNQGFPMCVEFGTGKQMWEKGRGAGTGSAAIIAADGHLYFRYENAKMALIEANPKAYQLKSSFDIASRHGKSWAHPVINNGKLYLRDQHQLHCYAIKQN